MSDKSGPAFPFKYEPSSSPILDALQPSGMSKRELFAAMAMAAFNAFPTDATAEEVSRASVKAADALLAELERTK